MTVCVCVGLRVQQPHLTRVKLIGLWGWGGRHPHGALTNQCTHVGTHAQESADMQVLLYSTIILLY